MTTSLRKAELTNPLIRKVYHLKFSGVWLSAHAVVVAKCERQAKALLLETLTSQHPYLVDDNRNAKLIECRPLFITSTTEPYKAVILDNGDY